MTRVLALLGFASLVACGHPAASTPTAPTGSGSQSPVVATGPLDVSLRVRAERAKMHLDVAPDDALRTGDYVELYVDVTAPAYVYVVQFLANGTSAVLFPETGDRKIEPGKSFRIPEGGDGDWFQLDSTTGIENLYVVASREPVAKVDSLLGGQIAAIRTAAPAEDKPVSTPDPPKPPDPTPVIDTPDPAPTQPTTPKTQPLQPVRLAAMTRPTHMLTLASRGIKHVKRTDGGAAVVSSTAQKREDAYVVLHFSFKHDP